MLAMRRNKDNIFDSIKSSDSAVTCTDFLEACRRIRASLVRGIDVDINPVKWEDIGGLDDVKRQLQKTVEWPLKHADAFFRLGISPPHGILLYAHQDLQKQPWPVQLQLHLVQPLLHFQQQMFSASMQGKGSFCCAMRFLVRAGRRRPSFYSMKSMEWSGLAGQTMYQMKVKTELVFCQYC
jgi:hypothetical protein